MKIKLVYVNGFDSVFKDITYYIYQFIDPQTLTIINYSTQVQLDKLVTGTAYDCILTIKKNKLSIQSINL